MKKCHDILSRPSHPAGPRRAFSLLEVLLAIFILGIGLIMVASVFPVGANWTKQVTEESVAQNVAQSAIGVLKTYYDPSNPTANLKSYMAPDFLLTGPADNPNNFNSILKADGTRNVNGLVITPFVLQVFPGLHFIPPNLRAYQLGTNTPFPAKDPAKCVYFWTALARLNPAHANLDPPTPDPFNNIIPAPTYKYDVYILVFRKGDPGNTFEFLNDAEVRGFLMTPLPVKTFFDRDVNPPHNGAVNFDPLFNERLIPSVRYAQYVAGTYNGSQWTVPAVPYLNEYGIGAQSGTVFKQVLNSNYDGALPRPLLLGQSMDTFGKIVQDPRIRAEPIIFSPPADGASPGGSPLVYIYQTTLTF